MTLLSPAYGFSSMRGFFEENSKGDEVTIMDDQCTLNVACKLANHDQMRVLVATENYKQTTSSKIE